MRRISVLIATISLVLSGLVISPANAAGYDGTNGTVDCLTDGVTPTGFFTIEANVVTGNTGCAGEVNIPSGVTTISSWVFYNRDLITSVKIPKSVTVIDVGVFNGCLNLSTVTFESGSKLATIMPSAFRSTESLASIEIPYGVTSIGESAFQYAKNLTSITFLGNAPTVETLAFANIGASPTARVSFTATGFTLTDDKWNGFTVAREFEDAIAAEAARVTAAELASRTVSAKKKYTVKPLALKVGVTVVSAKAKVSISIAKSSKNICTKSGSKLKTLKAGNCVVTFSVQEPKPKKGKKPKATKTFKTLVVQ